jgi:DEAD/DEAH box helicase domain-containing protein
VVLDSILGRPIDVEAIPMQEPAKGVTPGGTIDLAAAGVRPRATEGARRDREIRGVMEEEEMEEAERVEREAALAELLGGGPVAAEGGEGGLVFDLNETGGFLQTRS